MDMTRKNKNKKKEQEKQMKEERTYGRKKEWISLYNNKNNDNNKWACLATESGVSQKNSALIMYQTVIRLVGGKSYRTWRLVKWTYNVFNMKANNLDIEIVHKHQVDKNKTKNVTVNFNYRVIANEVSIDQTRLGQFSVYLSLSSLRNYKFLASTKFKIH